MEKHIKIQTDKSKIFRQWIATLQPVIKLRDKEADVLSELLYQNNENKEFPEDKRWIIIFDYNTKRTMMDKLNLSGAHFDNILSGLRKKSIIIDNKVIKNLLFYPEEKNKITFEFIIND